MLHEVQIYAYTPEEAAMFVSRIENLYLWWGDTHRQDAVETYLNYVACYADGDQYKRINEFQCRLSSQS